MIFNILTIGSVLTEREWLLLFVGFIVYAILFVLTIRSNRKKIVALQQRLKKVDAMQEVQESQSQQNIEQNAQKIEELEALLHKLGDENLLLRLQLEEKKATLDYTNKVAKIENEKRQQAETVILSSNAYQQLQAALNQGRSLSPSDWRELTALVNSVYTGFTEKLYSLYKLSDQDYHVSLLVKMRLSPKDIAQLTAHSKESVATTRSRLYQKVFGKKGSSKEWDEFILKI